MGELGIQIAVAVNGQNVIYEEFDWRRRSLLKAKLFTYGYAKITIFGIIVSTVTQTHIL